MKPVEGNVREQGAGVRKWALFEDEDGVFRAVTEGEGDDISWPEMGREDVERMIAEHNRVVDAFRINVAADIGYAAQPAPDVAGLLVAVAAVEKALPEGWVFECGDYPPDPDRAYWAQAYGPEVHGEHITVGGAERTPTLADALNALAAALIAARSTSEDRT